MEYRVISGNAIDTELIHQWQNILSSNTELTSPFLTPEYVKAVSSVRSNVYVGVLKNNNEVLALLPFQKKSAGLAVPVGENFCDYQALITDATNLNVKEFLSKIGISILEYDHLLASQHIFNDYHDHISRSPIIDLSSGYQQYCEQKNFDNSKVIGKIERQLRVLERDHGSVTFDYNNSDLSNLEKVLELKSKQCRETGLPNIFAQTWTRKLIYQIFHTKTEHMSGVLSVLSIADKAIAIHFGMRSKQTLHYWLPVYDKKFSKYSPGLILLNELAKSSESEKYQVIDLGKGEMPYKSRMMNGEIAIAQGVVRLRNINSVKYDIKQKALHITHSFPHKLKASIKKSTPPELLAITQKIYGRSKAHLPRVINQIPTNEKIVALTFDDGPHPEATPAIVKLLNEFQVKASFFLLGRHIKAYPEVVQLLIENGHFIGNHSFSHPDFYKTNNLQIRNEVSSCNKLLQKSFNIHTRILRPPYGHIHTSTLWLTKLMGYSIVNWSASADDWQGESADILTDRVLSQIKPGSIILFHDALASIPQVEDSEQKKILDRKPTIEAVGNIVKKLHAEDYQFCTLNKLIAS